MVWVHRQLGRRAVVVAMPHALLLAAGCMPARVQESGRYAGPPLPPPERILVLDLGVLPADVKLDDGMRARFESMVSNEPVDAQRLRAGRQAAAAVSDEVASRLRSYGLPAERSAALPPPGAQRIVLVEGHMLSVDEGNRTQRTIIGFGRGQSSVTVEAQVYYRDGAAAPRLIDNFQARAESPRTPGAVATMGGGAIAGRLAESAAASGIMRGVTEARSADPGSEGRRIGDALALRLGRLFAQLGWVPAAAVS